MPCVISDDDLRHYEREANAKLFGEHKLTGQITEEVACAMARYLYAAGVVQYQQPLVQKWIEHHKAKDEAAGRAWLK